MIWMVSVTLLVNWQGICVSHKDFWLNTQYTKTTLQLSIGLRNEGTMTGTQNRGKTAVGRRLPKNLTAEMQDAVATNREVVLREIQNSEALLLLLQRWGDGEVLTSTQSANVRTQLGDICLRIPDLAPYLTPYGSILLAALLKKLPFGIVPATVITSCAGLRETN